MPPAVSRPLRRYPFESRSAIASFAPRSVRVSVNRTSFPFVIGDEARDRVNQSEIHLDFMIGSEELKISGVTPGGEHVPVLVEGHWQV